MGALHLGMETRFNDESVSRMLSHVLGLWNFWFPQSYIQMATSRILDVWHLRHPLSEIYLWVNQEPFFLIFFLFSLQPALI